jgi:hypothetical protein
MDSYSVPLVLLDVVLGETWMFRLRHQMAGLRFVSNGVSNFIVRSIVTVILPVPPTGGSDSSCLASATATVQHLCEAFILLVFAKSETV